MKVLLSRLVVLTALASGPAGQVPLGDAVRFTFAGDPLVGIEIVDADGSGEARRLAGLSRSARQINDGLIDPVTGQLWCLGVGRLGGHVFRFTLDGAAVVKQERVADLSNEGEQLDAVAMDRDGNVFVCAEGGIWRIDRSTFEVTRWAAGPELGDLNAMEIDRRRNVLWTASLVPSVIPAAFPSDARQAQLRRYSLDEGPSSGEPVVNLTAEGMSGPRAIAVDDQGLVYVAGSTGLLVFDGATFDVEWLRIELFPESFFGPSHFNSLDYDSMNGTLHSGGGIETGVYNVIDPGTLEHVTVNSDYSCSLACLDNPVVSGVFVNDYSNGLEVLPLRAPRSRAFTLEVAVAGQPEDTGLVAIVEVNDAQVPPVPLAAGSCAPTGRLSERLEVPPMGPAVRSLRIAGATFDSGTKRWIERGTARVKLDGDE